METERGHTHGVNICFEVVSNLRHAEESLKKRKKILVTLFILRFLLTLTDLEVKAVAVRVIKPTIPALQLNWNDSKG